jgi:hypothetical protein
MAKLMTKKEWIVLAYKEGKKDLAQRLLDEINQIDIYGTDEYEYGANWAICEVIDIIRRLVGDSDDGENEP